MSMVFNFTAVFMLLFALAISYILSLIGLVEQDSDAFYAITGIILLLLDLNYRFGNAASHYQKTDPSIRSGLNHWAIKGESGGVLFMPLWMLGILLSWTGWTGGVETLSSSSAGTILGSWFLAIAGALTTLRIIYLFYKYPPQILGWVLALLYTLWSLGAPIAGSMLIYRSSPTPMVIALVVWLLSSGLALVVTLMWRDAIREKAFDKIHGKGAANKIINGG